MTKGTACTNIKASICTVYLKAVINHHLQKFFVVLAQCLLLLLTE